MRSHSLLQGIFPTRGSNLDLPPLQADSLPSETLVICWSGPDLTVKGSRAASTLRDPWPLTSLDAFLILALFRRQQKGGKTLSQIPSFDFYTKPKMRHNLGKTQL